MTDQDFQQIVREIEQMLVVQGWGDWSRAAARGEW